MYKNYLQKIGAKNQGKRCLSQGKWIMGPTCPTDKCPKKLM